MELKKNYLPVLKTPNGMNFKTAMLVLEKEDKKITILEHLIEYMLLDDYTDEFFGFI